MRLQSVFFSLCFLLSFLQAKAHGFLETTQAKLQNFINGFSTESNLSTSDSPLICYNQEDTHRTLTFLTDLFSRLENSQLMSLPHLVGSYFHDLSPEAIKCLSQHKQLQDILAKYNIHKKTLLEIISDAIRPLIFQGQQTSQNYIKLLVTKLENGDFEEAGTLLSQLVREIFSKNSELPVISEDIKDEGPISELKEMFEGFFSQAKITGNTTVINCYNNSTAKLTLNVLGAILVELSSNQFSDVSNTLMQYKRYLPSSVEVCTNKDDELQAALKEYKINGESLTTIFAAISSYAQNNPSAFNSVSCEISSNFQSGSYETVGKLIGSELQTIFG